MHATVWSALGFTAGIMIGTGIAVRRGTRVLDPRSKDRLLGAALILIALISTAQSLVFQRHQADVTKCQARYNEAFQKSLVIRGNISEEDRRNTVNMISELLGSTKSEQARAALERYVNTNAELERRRRNSPFPELASRNCKR